MEGGTKLDVGLPEALQDLLLEHARRITARESRRSARSPSFRRYLVLSLVLAGFVSLALGWLLLR